MMSADARAWIRLLDVGSTEDAGEALKRLVDRLVDSYGDLDVVLRQIVDCPSKESAELIGVAKLAVGEAMDSLSRCAIDLLHADDEVVLDA